MTLALLFHKTCKQQHWRGVSGYIALESTPTLVLRNIANAILQSITLQARFENSFYCQNHMENIATLRYERGRPMLLGGPRRPYAFADSAQGIAEQWQQFQSIGLIPGQLSTTRSPVKGGGDCTVGIQHV